MLGALLPAALAVCLVHPADLDPEVGRRALPWLPPDLARQVVRNKDEFARGAAAAAAWPRQFHESGAAGGLEATIVAQCERIVQALRSQAPFSEVVAGMGTLAHLTLDLNAPFAASPGSDPYARAFSAYQRTAAPRVKLVFYAEDRLLYGRSRAALERFVARSRRDAQALAPLIRYDLDRVGGPGRWRMLDDRSTSFGAAALTLNHSSSVFAHLASWIWQQGGGLVPEIAAGGTILVWKGEPRPRETSRRSLRVR